MIEDGAKRENYDSVIVRSNYFSLIWVIPIFIYFTNFNSKITKNHAQFQFSILWHVSRTPKACKTNNQLLTKKR